MLDLPFLPKQCHQRHSQCSPPRKQNRKYLCQSHLCRPDHSSRRKGDPWPNRRHVGLFSLLYGIWKTLLYNSRFVKLSKNPVKRNMWPCWPLYLFMWARDRCRSKKNPSLLSNRTSHLTSNNFRRTNEKFVQLPARHFKITIFFYLSDQMRDCHAVLTRQAWHLRLWREELSRAARFSPNAVIITPYCRLKIELSFLDIHNNLFLSGVQVFLCRSFLHLISYFARDLFQMSFVFIFYIFAPFWTARGLLWELKWKGS